MSDSPLQEIHVDAGAVMRDFYGREVAGSYGHATSEYDALRNGVAAVDRSHNVRVEHSGADALDLLHRLTTNELLSLGESEARPTVLTSERGRVVELFTVVRRSGKPLLLMAGAVNRKGLIEGIDRFTIIEDSSLEDVTERTAQITLLGPDAGRVVATVMGDDAAGLRLGVHVDATLAGVSFEAIRTDSLGLPTTELIVPKEGAPEVWCTLVEAGAVPAGMDAFEAVRIERGAPASGQDVDEGANPLEAGLESIVDFDKGCYVGQEVIARLDTYDKLQRRLTGLLAAEPLSPGEPIASGVKRVGRVTSATDSPGLGRPVGLGYVRIGFLEPGTKLTAEDGSDIEVAVLPLVE